MEAGHDAIPPGGMRCGEPEVKRAAVEETSERVALMDDSMADGYLDDDNDVGDASDDDGDDSDSSTDAVGDANDADEDAADMDGDMEDAGGSIGGGGGGGIEVLGGMAAQEVEEEGMEGEGEEEEEEEEPDEAHRDRADDDDEASIHSEEDEGEAGDVAEDVAEAAEAVEQAADGTERLTEPAGVNGEVNTGNGGEEGGQEGEEGDVADGTGKERRGEKTGGGSADEGKGAKVRGHKSQTAEAKGGKRRAEVAAAAEGAVTTDTPVAGEMPGAREPVAAGAAGALIPVACVKRIMHADDEVRQVSSDAALLVASAAQLFLESLAAAAFTRTRSARRLTVNQADVAGAVRASDKISDFIGSSITCLRQISNIRPHADSAPGRGSAGAEGSRKRQRAEAVRDRKARFITAFFLKS
ncbi:hypothetical protein CLOP_g2799 [Closterium sp. NIES-67]|nr:hypothetical protein CLOP_g2799 [Closterium sp. NIES-67]